MKKSNSSLPTALYTAEQVRSLDCCAIEDHQLSASLLMKRAGKAAFDQMLSLWPQLTTVHVFCGSGNNGGDGYVLAALAAQRNLTVTVWQLATAEKLVGAALDAYCYACQEKVMMQSFSPLAWQQQLPINSIDTENIIIDALLGTGVIGSIRPEYAEAIAAINCCHCPVLALDMPSGVEPDTGHVNDMAVEADATISFIGLKLGLFP